QAARDTSQRLDEQRRRDRLPGPQLRQPAEDHPPRQASLLACGGDRRSAPRPRHGLTMERLALAPGYEISRIIRGGWQLAGGHGAIDGDEAAADLLAAFDAGITTFDCADI